MKNIINDIAELFLKSDYDSVIISALGSTMTKALITADIVRRSIKGLY